MNASRIGGQVRIHYIHARVLSLMLLIPLVLCYSATPDNGHSRELRMSDAERNIHTLNRLSFGAAPGMLKRISTIGVWAWIDEQLNSAHLEESDELRHRLAERDTLSLSTHELALKYP